MKFLVPTLIVIIIVLAAFLSFFLGRSSIDTQKSAASDTQSPSEILRQTPTPTETLPETKKVSGGGILSFPKYELQMPTAWVDLRESQNKDTERIILKKDEYEITITQGGFGGTICLFPGDADVEGPSARYESFEELVTKSEDKFRRSWTGEENKTKGFGICQMTDYGWQAPTLYGHISFITPINSDPEVIAEMDKILSSLTKI